MTSLMAQILLNGKDISEFSISNELHGLSDLFGFGNDMHKSSELKQVLDTVNLEISSISEILKTDALELKTACKACASIAVTLSLSTAPLIGNTAVNSVNNGRNIVGGTYYNTAGHATIFKNTGSGGLWLKSSNTVRGLESNTSGTPTGNGGTVFFKAPGSVVRLDGDVNVNALKSGGLYTGNGGRVFVESAYLYQKGNIYANGINGGYVQFNVGSATIASGAKIMAEGSGGNGGKIIIKAKGSVDVQDGVIISTTGKVIGNYDTNVISIEGGLVNMEGVLLANGVDGSNGSSGGYVRLVANGNTDTSDALTAIDKVNNMALTGESSPMFTSVLTTSIKQRMDDLINNHDSHIENFGTIQTNGGNGLNGSQGWDGGLVYMNAFQSGHIHNFGDIEAKGGNGSYGADGGNGGNILLVATSHIENAGTMNADGGNGGNGANNSNGGHGGDAGIVMFSGYHNPGGDGFVSLSGGNGGEGDGLGIDGNGGNGGFLLINDPHNGTLYMTYDLSGGQSGEDCGQEGTMGSEGSLGCAKCPEAPEPYPLEVPPEETPPKDPPDPPKEPPVTPPYPKDPPTVPPNQPPTDTPLTWEQPHAYLTQEYPETILRKRLEKELADIPAEVEEPPVVKKAVKVKTPPKIKKPVHVRGFW